VADESEGAGQVIPRSISPLTPGSAPVELSARSAFRLSSALRRLEATPQGQPADQYPAFAYVRPSVVSLAYAGQGTGQDIPSGGGTFLEAAAGLSSEDVTWDPAHPDRLKVITAGTYLLCGQVVMYGGAAAGTVELWFQADGSKIGADVRGAALNDNGDISITTCVVWTAPSGFGVDDGLFYLVVTQTTGNTLHTYGSLEGQLFSIVRLL
jgi:hypothetical protein